MDQAFCSILWLHSWSPLNYINAMWDPFYSICLLRITFKISSFVLCALPGSLTCFVFHLVHCLLAFQQRSNMLSNDRLACHHWTVYRRITRTAYITTVLHLGFILFWMMIIKMLFIVGGVLILSYCADARPLFEQYIRGMDLSQSSCLASACNACIWLLCPSQISSTAKTETGHLVLMTTLRNAMCAVADLPGGFEVWTENMQVQ